MKMNLSLFSDSSPVWPRHVREVLNVILSDLGLDPSCYGVHSLRIGRASDLVNKFNCSVDYVRQAGRWQSNIVYKYIRN